MTCKLGQIFWNGGQPSIGIEIVRLIQISWITKKIWNFTDRFQKFYRNIFELISFMDLGDEILILAI